MPTATNLTNQFLIAMPTLSDPNFDHSVTFICEHNENGAMGIVINRPSELRLAEIFDQLEIHTDYSEVRNRPIYFGGPVQQDRGFVLHSPGGEWDSSFEINPQVAITTSKDILKAIAGGEGPARNFIALGYAGWGGGQLEKEIAENAWICAPANTEVIFELPDAERWQAAAAAAGIDINRISSDFGHA